MTILPIDSILGELTTTLHTHPNCVLIAAPGAGKTTRVPLALLDEPWLGDRRILMLEPRRLAARSAARYMARSLGEQVGETVGYRVRNDTKVGPKTRIEVITEGVLTRLLQADPALEDVGIIIFDEFHERSLQSDLGLALALQSQAILRDDLRLLIMSATLEAEPVAAMLDDAPIITSEGRSYPVETRYLSRPLEKDKPIESAVVRAIQNALAQDQGDLLVFLPGAGEIHRVEKRLHEIMDKKQVRIAPLYGNLPQEAQDAAIAPSVAGVRKVVLSTSIAETSLTVEGVQVVIDSGLARVSRFSPRTGMTRLETTTVSRASADQRRGRAGRLEPGVCYRLWTEQEDRMLPARSTPEILDSDLVPLALELAVWGVADPSELLWLDPPPKAAFSQARQLLEQLGALDAAGTVTDHGRRIVEMGLQPRLAHIILKAIPLGLGGLACELAAILSERDFVKVDRAEPNRDISMRVEVLRKAEGRGGARGAVKTGGNHGKTVEDGDGLSTVGSMGDTVDTGALRRIVTESQRLKQSLTALESSADTSKPVLAKDKSNAIHAGSSADLHFCGLLLAFAYPERIAQRRDGQRYLLRNGRGAFFTEQQPLANQPYLVAVELDDQGAESRIFLAAAVDRSELEQHFADQIQDEAVIAWDRSAQAVRGRKRLRLGALMLKDAPLPSPDPDDVVTALLQGIQTEGLDILPWSKTTRQLQQRLHFMHQHDAESPDVSDEALTSTLSDWLAPYLYGMKSRDDLQRVHLAEALKAGLTWEQQQQLDEHAPTHITVPSGSRIPVDYSDPQNPVLAVRLQEMFGCRETPRIARGRVPLTIHLLSPAHRPVQVTRDLASFWQNTYFEVKKDLKGRYPKHHWPDDPLSAVATNRAKPRTT
ncbi:ATP-dependent helicase HrpB [Brevibacillus dissolubilis]|uniref:ATP-dependent helicase HrpB n=1 Tax=Brevibacillus dissolubilis TaxID=1844116 RepID=UPI001115D0F7|nr:ATP-dependent helicase HrpB [Brevibacillus dissolubilis]